MTMVLLKTVLVTITAFVGALIIGCCVTHEKSLNNSVRPDKNEGTLMEILAQEHFNVNEGYESLSLINNGRPIKALGLKIEQVSSEWTISQDFNGKYFTKSEIISDFISVDPNWTINLSEGTIGGILFFSAIRENNTIFRVSGSWLLDVNLDDERTKIEVRKAIVSNLFPVLEDSIEITPGWEHVIKKDSLSEYFRITTLGESGRRLKLSYEVKPNLKRSN